MDFGASVECYFFKDEGKGPFVIEDKDKLLKPHEWGDKYRSELEQALARHGALLLRNFDIHAISDFNKTVQTLNPKLLDYCYRSTPRTKLGGKIYTATEYPADRVIPLHNENAYSKVWPKKLFFFSCIVADEGGETPIADSRSIYKKVDSKIRENFEKYGLTYVRNYTQGIDLSWQEVFQTEDRGEVEQYCSKHDIEYEWKGKLPELTTKQTCQATVTHPVTGDKVWFNQAHLFHFSALDKCTQSSLIKELGKKNVPRNVFYGDRQPIPDEIIKHIQDVYNVEKVKFLWKKGDMMILDNLLFAHGRETYKGERKIAVAMA